MIKRRDLDYWRQEFKGITAKDIVHRIVTRFRPEQAEECDYDQDIVQDLLGQDSDDEDEPLMYAEEYENEEDTTMDFQTDTVLTDLSGKSTCLPDSVFYKYTKNLPSYWPDPKADDYQAFFRAFFLVKLGVHMDTTGSKRLIVPSPPSPQNVLKQSRLYHYGKLLGICMLGI